MQSCPKLARSSNTALLVPYWCRARAMLCCAVLYHAGPLKNKLLGGWVVIRAHTTNRPTNQPTLPVVVRLGLAGWLAGMEWALGD